jgi:magnesium-transporting ATPase (P-type)
LEFTSARKRMTVVVKNKSTNELHVFGKGADEVMFNTVAPDFKEELSNAKQMIESFASEGLRTLSMGYKRITQEEYDEWLVEFKKANKEIHDRDV